MTIEHEPDEPIDGPSLWQRFNNWQLRSLASAEVHADERHERHMLLRTRRRGR